MVTVGNFQILHQAETVALDGVMNAGFLEVSQQFRKMFSDQGGVLDRGIAKRPGCFLIHSVVPVKEQLKKLVETILGMADPVYDDIAVGFGMFFQDLCTQVHSLQINNFSDKK